MRPGSEERVGGHMVSYEYYKSGDQRIWRAGPEANPRREMRRIVAPNGTLTERVAEKLGDPSHRRYTYDYDDNRNMTKMVDVRPGGDRETWLGYDPNDRLLKVDERWDGGKDTEFRYDEDSHIQQRRTDGEFDDEDGEYWAAPARASPMTREAPSRRRSSPAPASARGRSSPTGSRRASGHGGSAATASSTRSSIRTPSAATRGPTPSCGRRTATSTAATAS